MPRGNKAELLANYKKCETDACNIYYQKGYEYEELM